MKFSEGKIIDKFFVERDGRKMEVILRYPRMRDAKQIMESYNKAIKETNLLSTINQCSLEKEKKWLKEIIDKMKSNNAVLLLVIADGKIVGNASVIRNKEEAMHHVGIFGIAINQEFTGMGIGSRMTKTILNLARNQMGLEIVKSCCFSGNEPSLRLHKKSGFRVIGKIPKGLKKKNKYRDEILLYKLLVSKQ